MFTGSKDNAKRVTIVNICMYCKKRKSLHVNIFSKRELAKKEMNVFTGISTLLRPKAKRNALTLKEVSADKVLLAHFSTLPSVSSVKTISTDSVQKDQNANFIMERST